MQLEDAAAPAYLATGQLVHSEAAVELNVPAPHSACADEPAAST